MNKNYMTGFYFFNNENYYKWAKFHCISTMSNFIVYLFLNFNSLPQNMRENFNGENNGSINKQNTGILTLILNFNCMTNQRKGKEFTNPQV